MKRLLSLILLCGAFSIGYAQKALKIYQKNGEVISYSFSEKPKIEYKDGALILTTKKTKVEYPLSSLKNMSFDDKPTSVEQVITQKSVDKIKVYDTNGKLIKTIETSDDGTSTISLDGLKTGIYIVKNGYTTYKIQKQ